MVNEKIVEQLFEGIKQEYLLEFGIINEDNFVLYCKKYAIIIAISREGVTLKYIKRDLNNSLQEYQIDTFVSKAFDDKDRKGIGSPQTIYDIIIAELKISAAGLMNHWKNILTGETEWIKDYMNHPFGGIKQKPNEMIRIYLEDKLENNVCL
jgi:hypothetical protein